MTREDLNKKARNREQEEEEDGGTRKMKREGRKEKKKWEGGEWKAKEKRAFRSGTRRG